MTETGIPSVISRLRLITESRSAMRGEARTRIYADGDNAYCIEPGISLHTGNTLEKDASVVWNNLGKAKQDAVNLALLYGAQGSMGQSVRHGSEKVLATQMVIWEIVTGCQECTAPYAPDGRQIL